jgi:hypothetical protein
MGGGREDLVEGELDGCSSCGGKRCDRKKHSRKQKGAGECHSFEILSSV